MLGPLAQAERPPVQVKPGLAGIAGDEQLGHGREGRQRALAAGGLVAGDVPPAEHAQALQRGDPLHVLAGLVRAARVAPSGPGGRKASPAAYEPAGGSAKPQTARNSSSGIWVRMPAPSPVSGSAPLAPRWSRLRSTVSAWATVLCTRRPDRSATMPTPQASCSLAGSYNPAAACGAAGRERGGREESSAMAAAEAAGAGTVDVSGVRAIHAPVV